MLAVIPLLILPLAAYNILFAGFLQARIPSSLSDSILSLQMLSGATWSMNVGDALVVSALLMLFVEILKATRRSTLSVADHLFSMLLFVAYLVEFLVVRDAATQVFFILTAIAFIDVVAGFSISIKAASRDVSIGL